MKNISIALTCLLLASACSKVQKAEENMKNMERTTTKMSATTDEMKDVSEVVYRQMRPKEAEETRSAKMAELLNPKVDMDGKFLAATVYFMSFEYQLWTGNNNFDSLDTRHTLLLQVANEFTKKVSGIYKKIKTKKMSPTKEGRSQNDEMAFYALAATMHATNTFQEEKSVKNGTFPVISFYDMVKTSLLKEVNGYNYEDYESVLVTGTNKEMMIELIKARVDVFAALALKNLTDKRNMTLGQKAKSLLFKLTGGRLGSIDLPEVYDQSNDPTKDSVITYLEGALKAKNFLREIGVNKTLEKTTRSALINIDLGEEVSDGDVAMDEKREEIQSLINKILE